MPWCMSWTPDENSKFNHISTWKKEKRKKKKKKKNRNNKITTHENKVRAQITTDKHKHRKIKVV